MYSCTDGSEFSGEVAAAARRVTGVSAMLAKYPLADLPDDPSALPGKHPVAEPVRLPDADVSELIHLARAVLLKSHVDLGAIAQASPAMLPNWIDAFTAERARAETEAKFWSAAIAYLMATAPGSIANDG
jgi:hypothetical protein